ncbi:MAG: hypothetical protein CENE_03696 [Candidatus Celerinatantimonas neptuna]|nr:MAG: hypothetical protein CENE_03696 [Candidatus Celerinatantimonas neptuna]
MSNFSTTIRDGVRFSKAWPKEAMLASIFLEHRVINLIPFVNRVMPALAVITVLLPCFARQPEMLPQSAIFALLFLAAPFHLFYWLGRRANRLLSPSLANWYRELHHKLSMAGETMKPIVSKPRYFELAYTLSKAFNRFDKGFVIYGS